MNEIWKYDGVGQADLLKRGELSPRELLEATIRRIERIEPQIHALTATRFEEALQSVDDQVPGGRLGGVPFLVKDLISYPGMPLTFGSRLFRMNLTDEVSPFTTRIQEANLRMLGKTTTSEFGLLGSTESLLSGVSRNPGIAFVRRRDRRADRQPPLQRVWCLLLMQTTAAVPFASRPRPAACSDSSRLTGASFPHPFIRATSRILSSITS